MPIKAGEHGKANCQWKNYNTVSATYSALCRNIPRI